MHPVPNDTVPNDTVPTDTAPAEATLPDILLEDGPLLAVNKPAGLLTQAAGAVPSLESQIRAWIKQRYGKPGNVYLGVPHRLDRPTSGVLVFARNSKAAARLSEQFEKRQVRKLYLAVVEQAPTELVGTLTDFLWKDPERAHVTVVPEGTPGAKQAMLRYRVAGATAKRTLLEIEPQTGRMHQLRVQLAARGWPVLGDLQYGGPPLEGVPDAIALHARRLTLRHPVRYDEVTIEAPPPVWWERLTLPPLP